MPANRLAFALTTCAVCLAAICSTAVAEPTTVALTQTVRQPAGPEQQLGAKLLDLLALGVQSDQSLSVVERRQIDLVIQEHVLDRSQPADPQLQLGKLLTADFLVMLETLPADKDSPKPWGRLRVVDAKTAAIRGVTVTALDETTLDETADQFAGYASTVIHSPEQPTVTVAVVPFESNGRFDRLRPLELGIRDLVTQRLLELSGAAAAAPGEGTDKLAEPPNRFQVVQRSNMEQLLAELDLIRSGFSDKDRLPENLPQRAATYLVRGEIDERQVDDKYTVIVRGETVQVATLRVVDKFELECLPAELPGQLAARVDALAQRLWIDEKIEPPAHVPEFFEIQSLKKLVLADLRRFWRRSPTDHGQRTFGLPGDPPANWARMIKPDSPQGHYVLRKSIDRLESILYINPDDAEVAYALGFCYSFHEPEIYRPQRAVELLRQAYAIDPDSELAASVLGYYAEINYHHDTAALDAGSEADTKERLWFAFEHTPVKFRDHHWPRYLWPLQGLLRGKNRIAELGDLMDKVTPYAEVAAEKDKFRNMVADSVALYARQLTQQAADPALRSKASELLRRWGESNDPLLVKASGWVTANMKLQQGDPVGAAAAFEAAAAKMTGLDRGIQLVKAATSYRTAGQPERALKVLASVEAKNPPGTASLFVGMHGLELGTCYQMLGQKEKALEAYVRAAEDCPSIVDNSDILGRINALGGVPAREDREVDAVYYPKPTNNAAAICVATDGRKIFCGGPKGLEAFDIATKSWVPQPLRTDAITCLSCRQGELWAGTSTGGLWRCSLASGEWFQVAAGQLPDPHVESITLAGDDLYVGVGSTASGGLVRIDKAGIVVVFSDSGAPAAAPTHVVITDDGLWARTPGAIYKWTAATNSWSQPDEKPPSPAGKPRLFAGKTSIWASVMRHELTRWQATGEENAQFKSAWYDGTQKLGYNVNFLAERGDDVWFAGQAWERFASAGLYRFNLKTGSCYRFGPRDGFKGAQLHTVYDGVWLDDVLWLATDQGLCQVTPRTPVKVAAAPTGG